MSKQHRVFSSFLPRVSADAIKACVRYCEAGAFARQRPRWPNRRSDTTRSRSLWNYYRRLYQTAIRELAGHINWKLEQWARRKYKTLSRHKRRSVEWLARMKECSPEVFVHWSVFESEVG
jgi:RNA-directed DNA polymerase